MLRAAPRSQSAAESARAHMQRIADGRRNAITHERARPMRPSNTDWWNTKNGDEWLTRSWDNFPWPLAFPTPREPKADWVANKRFEISKFKFKIPRARTSELQGSFSAVSKPNFASKYSVESSRRDLHNPLLCTVLNRIPKTKKNMGRKEPGPYHPGKKWPGEALHRFGIRSLISIFFFKISEKFADHRERLR